MSNECTIIRQFWPIKRIEVPLQKHMSQPNTDFFFLFQVNRIECTFLPGVPGKKRVHKKTQQLFDFFFNFLVFFWHEGARISAVKIFL